MTAISALLGRCRFPAPGTPLTCAVSGGPDSLALLVLATRAGCVVTAVHVDHGLRPGSAGEAEVVAAAAAVTGAVFRAVTAHVAHGSNLEARARAVRRAAIGAPHATGHTADDRAETVLLALLRGTGIDGLASLRPGPEHPLLDLRRHETEAVCRDAGLTPVRDPSNDDPRFRRNRVRHELLPLLADIGERDPVPLLCRLADLAALDADALDRASRAAVPDPGDARAVAAAEPALAARAVRRLLAASAGGEPAGPADPLPPARAEVDRILAVARGEAVATEVAGRRRVARRRGRLRVEVVEAPQPLPGDRGAP